LERMSAKPGALFKARYSSKDRLFSKH
jgi:hypothetical protein